MFRGEMFKRKMEECNGCEEHMVLVRDLPEPLVAMHRALTEEAYELNRLRRQLDSKWKAYNARVAIFWDQLREQFPETWDDSAERLMVSDNSTKLKAFRCSECQEAGYEQI